MHIKLSRDVASALPLLSVKGGIDTRSMTYPGQIAVQRATDSVAPKTRAESQDHVSPLFSLRYSTGKRDFV